MNHVDRSPVLTVNAGGSSIKLHYFLLEDCLAWCSLTHLDTAHPRFACSWDGSAEQVIPGAMDAEVSACFLFGKLTTHLQTLGLARPAIVAHRVKFAGGPQPPCIIDARLIDRLRSERSLAAMHNPMTLALIEEATQTFEDAHQTGIFDNELFSGPWAGPEAAPFAPRIMSRFELARDGHHGLAIESVLDQFQPRPAERIVVIHLGSGSSVSAFSGRRPAYCSMGYTSFDGPVMNSRSGSVSAGLVVKLLSRGATPSRISSLLHNQSGIFAWAQQDIADRGLVKEILPSLFGSAPRNPFTATVICEIVFATVAMGGCDAIIFSGGLSRSSPESVSQISSYLAELGLIPSSPSVCVSMVATPYPGIFICREREELVLLRKATSITDNAIDHLEAVCVVPGKAVGILTCGRSAQPSEEPQIRWLAELTTEEALHSRHFAAIIAGSGDRLGHAAAIARELMLTTVICHDLEPETWVGSRANVDATEGRITRC